MKENDLIAGRYRLLRPIGAGAMGSVWAARHELLGREFAIKVAKPPADAPRDAHERFLREAQIIARLRHPNIVDVADVGEHECALYIAMELLSGESLGARIARGALPPNDAARIMSEVARGLAVAHAAGVVHRDLKPENIFLARGSSGGMVPKLLDFGVSKGPADVVATLGGELFGTPAYMSPEQASGEMDLDHRTDLWSFGVVLYEAITQQRPFTAPNYQALLRRISESPHRPLQSHIPGEIRAVVDRCLAKSRFDRYASAELLREALEDALAEMDTMPELEACMPIESARSFPSLISLPPRDSQHRALSGHNDTTLSPSMQAVTASPRSRRAIGIVFGVGLLALAIVGRFAMGPGGEGSASAGTTDVAKATVPPPAGEASETVPANSPPAIAHPEPSGSASAAPTATPTPSASVTASPALKPPSGRPGRGAGRAPVTHVNSAGF